MNLTGSIAHQDVSDININSQVSRYIINGVVATVIHYIVLSIIIEGIHIGSAGTANFIAAIFGISASFFGSRYYVFRKTATPIMAQAAKFWLLYATMALSHGIILYIWSDLAGYDYRVGFLLATCVQVMASYFGNKALVFK